ncbi:MAG TPA: hypothetical protein VKD69_16960 [Vicinamibacterales bacterium]|nr:hypothetical protein [Vicinamibacterales bacterium]
MVSLSRRGFLSIAGASVLSRTLAAQDRKGLEIRIPRLIHEFEQQGDHRTGTAVDHASARWLQAQVEASGLRPALEPFSLSRVDLLSISVVAADRRIEGVPLFDGGFTDSSGISGRLGPLSEGTDIGLASTVPNQAAAGALGDARRANRHKAIVCVTNGRQPGLCPSNAEHFLKPFGPPVVQVSDLNGQTLSELARQGATVRVIARVTRTPATAVNVTATIAGLNSSLPPLVIMTPRSGWYSCASERGGGIVCWLELMRTLETPRPVRDIVFVASSGHELGYLGMNAFVDARPGIVKNSAGWIHLGANIGAAVEPGNNIQSSDDQSEAILMKAMTDADLRVGRRLPRGTVPGGEAEVVHRGGGRYVSAIGQNALFHNPSDRGPTAVDPKAIASFVDAFTAVARELSRA